MMYVENCFLFAQITRYHHVLLTVDMHDWTNVVGVFSNVCVRPKKLVFKSFKRYFFVFRDTVLSLHHSFDEKDGTPLLKYNLKGW